MARKTALNVSQSRFLKALWCGVFFTTAFARAQPGFQDFTNAFASGYNTLNIPGIEYDYREYLNTIPAPAELERQRIFFSAQEQLLAHFHKDALSPEDQRTFDHVQYVLQHNNERLRLEETWATSTREVPPGGLYSMPGHEQWYRYFIQKFTSTNISPEEVMAYGLSETKRVQAEINRLCQRIRRDLEGGMDSTAFQAFLQSDTFFITDRQRLLRCFETTDRDIRKHLRAFTGNMQVPGVHALEWPDAGPNTPPGMYLGQADNAYGRDVFYYNFSGQRYNWRTVSWLYMHEAIPGHHLQSHWRAQIQDTLGSLFLYPGNFEGWACYVEYYGHDLGVYADSYSELGKWEWDLVRSVRLVLDAGIHHYGWTREQALEFWKKNIHGQDDIAAREITRVTHWPAQALSYKVGAKAITEMRERLEKTHGKAFDQVRFHRAYLDMSHLPLAVVEKHIDNAYHDQ